MNSARWPRCSSLEHREPGTVAVLAIDVVVNRARLSQGRKSLVVAFQFIWNRSMPIYADVFKRSADPATFLAIVRELDDLPPGGRRKAGVSAQHVPQG